MNNCYYNGVLMPSIPEEILRENPYCWIRHQTVINTYQLMVSSQPWYYSSNNIYAPSGKILLYSINIAEAETSEWTYSDEFTNRMPVNSDIPCIWSNHDIVNGSISASTIYFAGSKALPKNYSIKILSSIEAEAGVLGGSAVVGDRTEASGNIVVDMITMSSGTLQLDFTVPFDDFYLVRMYFTHSGTREFSYTLNGKKRTISVVGTSYYAIESIDFQIYLSKGTNTVTFSGGSTSYAPMFDRFDIYEFTISEIYLTNQNQVSTNGTTSLSLTMSNCTPGNLLVLAYAIRETDDNVTITEGWKKLGGGNHASGLQRVYFASKKVKAAVETVTLTQTGTNRIYMVCSEYNGATMAKLRPDLASYGSTKYQVEGTKENVEDVIIYGISSNYYNGSGRLQTVTPTDLEKIQGDSSAERLACWFDNGTGALEHTFRTCNSSENYDVVLECVQLFSYHKKYLIRIGTSLFTVVDDTITPLSETELSASLFLNYGFDELPTGNIASPDLIDPELLYWHGSDDELPIIKSKVTGIPPMPQIIITKTYNMSHSSILGIESVTADMSDDVLCAISFNNGVTWKAYDGTQWKVLEQENSGMAKEIIENISTENWAAVVSGIEYCIRFVLPTETSYVNSLIINYINEEAIL